MSWEEICVLCQHEVERQEGRFSEHFRELDPNQNFGDLFLRWEQETNDVVEVAVRQFATSGEWPFLTPLQELMLWFRLDFAAGLTSLLGQQPKPWDELVGEDQREVRLTWLMLFAWGQEGFPKLNKILMQVPPATKSE